MTTIRAANIARMCVLVAAVALAVSVPDANIDNNYQFWSGIRYVFK